LQEVGGSGDETFSSSERMAHKPEQLTAWSEREVSDVMSGFTANITLMASIAATDDTRHALNLSSLSLQACSPDLLLPYALCLLYFYPYRLLSSLSLISVLNPYSWSIWYF
jgi:hypothetical protein